MTEPQLCQDCVAEMWLRIKADVIPRPAASAAVLVHGVGRDLALCLFHWSVRERKWRRLNQQKQYTVEPIPASKP